MVLNETIELKFYENHELFCNCLLFQRGGKSALRVNKKTSKHIICENNCIVWTKLALTVHLRGRNNLFVKDSLGRVHMHG